MMMTKIKKYLFVFAVTLSCCPILAQTGWRIVGDAVPESSAAMTQNPLDTREFIYKGQLTNLWFKITNGTKSYIPLCRENDPLGMNLDARSEDSATEMGFRIRYSSQHDFYKVTFVEGRTLSKVTAEKINAPDKVYLVGGPVNTHNPNWVLSDAKELEKEPENPFIFYYKGFLRYNSFGDEPGSIKFLIGLSWDHAYHPFGVTDVPLAQAAKLRVGGTDTKWTIPADKSGDGYYVIKLNTFDETISILEFDPNAEYFPENIFITGNAVPCGWTNTFPEVMTKITEKGSVYSWTGNILPGEFKLLKEKGSWGSCYVATKENEPIVFGLPHDLVYEFEYWNGSGNDYKFVINNPCQSTIRVDLKTMKITVFNNDLTGVPAVGKFVNFQLSRKAGIVYVKNTTGEKFNLRLFGIDGRSVMNLIILSQAEIALNKGMYIVEMKEEGFSTYRTKLIID